MKTDLSRLYRFLVAEMHSSSFPTKFHGLISPSPRFWNLRCAFPYIPILETISGDGDLQAETGNPIGKPAILPNMRPYPPRGSESSTSFFMRAKRACCRIVQKWSKKCTLWKPKASSKGTLWRKNTGQENSLLRSSWLFLLFRRHWKQCFLRM